MPKRRCNYSRYVCSLPERIREDYVLLVEQLTQRFGLKDPPTTVRRKLGELRQGKETTAEFAEEVRRLVTFAYPGVDLQLQDQLATDAFLKGLRNQKVAYEVMNRDPSSLAEAQKSVEAHEHNFKVTVGRDTEIKNRTRRISWADEDFAASEDCTASSRRVQTPQYVTTDQFTALKDEIKTLTKIIEKLQLQLGSLQSTHAVHQRAKSPVQSHIVAQQHVQSDRTRSRSPSPSRGAPATCFLCGEQGHFRRDCTKSLSPAPAHNHGENHLGNHVQSNSTYELKLSCAKSKGESLQIPITVNGIPTEAVVDTGAQTTVISEALYQNCSEEQPTSLCKTYLLNAGVGEGMKAKQGLPVTFKIASKTINWAVHVAPIRDSVLLGLDLMKAHDVVIHARGKVFIGNELVPSKIVGGDGADYSVARVLLREATTIPPTSECVVWGEVENPKPGVPAVLEPLNITEAVASGSVATTMEKQVPVRLCNFSTSKAALLKGVCLGLLVEAYPEKPKSLWVKRAATDGKSELENVSPLVIGRVATLADLPEHLHCLVEATSETLNEEQQQHFLQLLLTYQSLFAKGDSYLGYLSAVTHKIDTGLAKPVRQPVRRTPLGFQGEEETHLQDMLRAGVITPSSSEWASPVVLVRKKDGGVRWCVDYRSLNSLTIKDAYPLPKIECLDVLGRASLFSTLDLQSGYWQIAVDSKDREKTAFITKWGLYEYTRMPFGLCNAPSTFQRAMELVLRGLQWETLLIYLDDVIVLGRNVGESLNRLAQVFERLHEYGLKLKPSKCHLLQEEVLFLGHIVSGDGICPNPALVRDVQLWEPPSNIQELQAFLGLCNYYRKFVPSFAEIASPLHNLLKKGAVFQWTEAHEEAFTQLKERLTAAPVLGYPTAEGQFILDTDASSHSVGAVLSQLQWGEERVLTYASSHLTPAQQRYCVTRRELLAVVRFTRQFRHYLLGRKFLLRTDHGSLTWLFRFKYLEGQLARWLEELCQYDFRIEHRAGVKHSNADAMSRQGTGDLDKCDCYQAGKYLSELPCQGCKYCQRLHEQWARFEEDVDDVVPLAVRYLEPSNETNSADDHREQTEQTTVPQPATPVVNWLQSVSTDQLVQLQKADPVLSILHQWKDSGTLPTKDQAMLESPAVRKFWLCWPQIVRHQGVLFYCWEREGTQDPTLLLLVPSAMQQEVLQACHNPPHSGHLGEAKTLERLRQGYQIPDVHLFVKKCQHCNECKAAGPLKRAQLQSYQAGAPLDRLHLDILGPFPVSSSGNKYILVIIDQFTRWVEAFAVPDQGAETTAKKLVYEFIARFGSPLELHTDQGRNFESCLFQSVCRLLQITKTRTTPYHPASNGQVERFNRTLLQMIRCYVDKNQKNWDEHLPLLTSAYRSSRHGVTGFTPNQLMLGREVHQPHDLQSGTAELKSDRMEVADYLCNLREGLEEAQHTAREHLRAAQERQKKTYNVRAQEQSYSVGDLVYMKDDTKKKGLSPKLQAPWKGPFIVSARRGPVIYEIQGAKRSKIMHHDRLKPYASEVVPAWVGRQRSHVLQQRQDSADPSPKEDAPLVTDMLLQSGVDDASAEPDPQQPEPAEPDIQEPRQEDGASRSRASSRRRGRPTKIHGSPDKTFKTLRGRIVHKPL
ncbi:uncharacterized protein LOC132868818 [Neoarius graeffei]|uniref:uncharacterized protein LOC132868818 n=1 Tax=Neoarius graeffei TaxID=443677 RepID=UPI00298D1B95|nr:uncharacterized protein LOC132868818 [Neoarius graeffei]